MPLYRFRLEGKEGYREGSVSAESKEAAKAFLEKREAQYAAFSLEDEDLAGHEAAENADGVTPADSRSKLAMHRQSKPYKLTKLEKAS